MKFIDFRFRPNTPEVMNGIQNSNMFRDLCELINFSEKKAQTLDEIVKDMKERGIVKAVVTGRDSEVTYGSPSNNSSVIEFVSKYPDMFIGFAGLDPHKGMKAIDELKLMVEKHGMKGAAIDPYLAKIPANHAKYYPIYAKCCELNMPVIMTTGPATLVAGAVMDHVHPRYIDAVACDFPELKIIISHGCYPYVNEVILMVQRHRNVYMEYSEYEQMPFSEGYIQATNTFLKDRMLYASAHPFFDFKDQLDTYAKLPFTDDAREHIMYKNAAKLLGL